jgi:hypothetical protein
MVATRGEAAATTQVLAAAAATTAASARGCLRDGGVSCARVCDYIDAEG